MLEEVKTAEDVIINCFGTRQLIPDELCLDDSDFFKNNSPTRKNTKDIMKEGKKFQRSDARLLSL